MHLKDAFFSIPLSKLSHPIFGFEWVRPELRRSGQLTWTRSLQAQVEALNQDLSCLHSKYLEVTLLCFVDDLLLAVKDKEDCLEVT